MAKKVAKKKKKSVKAGASVTLVIPRAKGCFIEKETKLVKAGDRVVLVIPTAKKGCDI
jgi:hypothetical protein